MSETITVQVNQQHITDGIAADGYHCPIALALRDRYPLVTTICVGRDYVALNDQVYALDFDGAMFVSDFDCYETAKPCELTLTKTNRKPIDGLDSEN